MFQRKNLGCVYIDDVVVACSDEVEHKNHLTQIFNRFKDHRGDENGIQPLESKVSAVTYFPLPQSQHQIRQLLCLMTFYYRFIPHCSQSL
uniref:Reverse transcriptase domain-containing protein n=1 Tax=Amphimedon queenslandica TaxID=400682 RepID=A0A1X7VGQ7_AMPQE